MAGSLAIISRAAALVGIIFTKLVDQLIRDDAAAPREGPKSINCLGLLYRQWLWWSHESTAGQLGNYLSDGLPFALRPLLGGLQHVIGDI